MSSPLSASKLVVADAGPLISLGRLDLLSLLALLFGQVHVPQAVLDECMVRPAQDDAARIQAAVSAGCLLPCAATPVQVQGLDAGECAAIGLALELGAGLLVDDLAARVYAMEIGLPVIGTLGLLVRAKRLGAAAEVAPLILRLRASGQRLSEGAVAQTLQAAGEAAP